MTRLTRWQRSVAFLSHPLWTLPFCWSGLPIVAYYLAKYGLGNAILRRQLFIGLCAGLVYTAYYKWLYRRDLSSYVNQALGLRGPDTWEVALRAFVTVLCVMSPFATDHPGNRMLWPAYGMFMLATFLLYPEVKALHEGIKVKLAEMESTPQQEGMG